MKFSISNDSVLSQYEQISEVIANEIRSGSLPKGSKLPSVRNLAKDANISHVTADRVLENLKEKGMIERVQGSGSFVIYNLPFGEDKKISISEMKNKFLAVKKEKNYRTLLVALLKNTTHICPYNFSYALLNPEFVSTIFPNPSELQNDLLEYTLEREYGDMKGIVELRELLIVEYNLEYKIDESLITNGNQNGIFLIAQALINKGDNVLIESPTYTGAVDVFYNAEANLVPINLHDEGFDKEQLEKLCQKYKPKIVFLTPNFSNPTGYYLTIEERKELLELAQKYNFLIVEDDHWSEIYLDEKIVPIAALEDASKHVVYLRGFSKLIGPDARIGAMFAPEYIIEKVKDALVLQSLGVSVLSQKYLISIFKRGYYRRGKKYITNDLRKRKSIVNKLLLPLKKLGVKYDIPQGGLNFWIQLPQELDAEKLLFSKIYERGITYLPGSITNVSNRAEYNHCFRLCYTYLSINNLKSGLKILVELIEDEIKK